MDLKLYRRHSVDCRVKATRRKTRRDILDQCDCPFWCDGYMDGDRINKSLKTSNKERAERRMLAMSDPSVDAGKTLADAIAAYLTGCKVKTADSTYISYKGTLTLLQALCEERGLSSARGAALVEQIKLDTLEAFQAVRKTRDGLGAGTLKKEVTTLRTFFTWCVDAEIIKASPARKLKPPKQDGDPVVPFTDTEVEAILAACAKLGNKDGIETEWNGPVFDARRTRMRVFIEVLLATGLRISDAAKLKRSDIDPATNRLTIRMMKTRLPLTQLLEQHLVNDLLALPERGTYFFWSAEGKLSTCVTNLRATFDRVLKLAGLKGHPHMCRHTFARNYLDAGGTIRGLQIQLGHSSIRTTERTYASFVKGQQDLQDAEILKLHAARRNRRIAQVGSDHGIGDAKGNILPFPA